MVTSTVPAETAGLVAVTWVALLTVKLEAACVPKLTAVAPVRFVPVMVTVVPPPSGPEAGLTALTVGGGTTVRVAVLDVVPVPPLAAETGPLVLPYEPAVLLLTLTATLQLEPLATDPPARLRLPEPATPVAVPPQVVLSPLGVAITRLVGNVSLKATPVRATVLVPGLAMVIVRVETPLTALLVGLKALVMVGGATTAIEVVLEVVPLPPSVDEMAPVVLLWAPAALPVTLTTSVQLVLPARLRADRLTLALPAAAVGVPPQVPPSPLGVEITKPAGRVSLKPMPLTVVPLLGLAMVKVSVVEPLSGMEVAPKALLIVGGETTVRLAVPAPPEPPSLEVAVTELFLVPAVLPVTLTTTVQLAPAVSVAPDRLTLVAPPVAVMVPLPAQVPVTPGVEATPRSEGRVSVKPIPVRAIVLVPGLVTVKVRVVDPL